MRTGGFYADFDLWPPRIWAEEKKWEAEPSRPGSVTLCKIIPPTLFLKLRMVSRWHESWTDCPRFTLNLQPSLDLCHRVRGLCPLPAVVGLAVAALAGVEWEQAPWRKRQHHVSVNKHGGVRAQANLSRVFCTISSFGEWWHRHSLYTGAKVSFICVLWSASSFGLFSSRVCGGIQCGVESCTFWIFDHFWKSCLFWGLYLKGCEYCLHFLIKTREKLFRAVCSSQGRKSKCSGLHAHKVKSSHCHVV